MKVIIEIETDNAAFDGRTGSETARILRGICQEIKGKKLVAMVSDRSLFDMNGNKVGTFKVEA